MATDHATQEKLCTDLINSETNYLKGLEVLEQFYLPAVALIRQNEKEFGAQSNDFAELTMNLPTLIPLHACLLKDMRNVEHEVEKLASLLSSYARTFLCYTDYVCRYESALLVIDRLKQKKKFKELFEGVESKITAQGYVMLDLLSTPLDRLQSYDKWLANVILFTDKSSPLHEEIKTGLVKIEEIGLAVTEAKKKMEGLQRLAQIQALVKNLPGDFTWPPHRTLLREGKLTPILESYAKKKKKTLSSSSDRIIYLFSDKLLITRLNHTYRYDVFNSSITVEAVPENETDFSVSNSKMSVVFRCTTLDDRQRWIKDLLTVREEGKDKRGAMQSARADRVRRASLLGNNSSSVNSDNNNNNNSSTGRASTSSMSEIVSDDLTIVVLKTLLPLDTPLVVLQEEIVKLHAKGVWLVSDLARFTLSEMEGIVKPTTARCLKDFLKQEKGVFRALKEKLKSTSSTHSQVLASVGIRTLKDEVTVSFLRTMLPADTPVTSLHEDITNLNARGIWTLGELGQYSVVEMEKIIRPQTAHLLKFYLKDAEEIDVAFVKKTMPDHTPPNIIMEEVNNLRRQGVTTIHELRTMDLVGLVSRIDPARCEEMFMLFDTATEIKTAVRPRGLSENEGRLRGFSDGRPRRLSDQENRSRSYSEQDGVPRRSFSDFPPPPPRRMSEQPPPPPPRKTIDQPAPPPFAEHKSMDQVTLAKLQEQTEALVKVQAASLSVQLGQALEALRGDLVSQSQHERDLETLKQAIGKEPQALPALVDAAITTPEFQDMLIQTERRMQATLRSHAMGIQTQLEVVTTHLSAVSAKTDAMYDVYSNHKLVLLEQEALLKSVVAPFYTAINAVLSARLQAVLLVASGVIQGKQGSMIEKAKLGSSSTGALVEGVGGVALQAVTLAAEVSALAATAVPLVGCVVGALLRKGAERIDEYRSEKRQKRAAARAVTTADAEALGELAARRCAQFFSPLIEGDAGRLDEEALERAGRKAGQAMYDALVGGTFDVFLDEAEAKDAGAKDQELTAQAMCLAVRKKAVTETGVLKKEGGIFIMKLTQADVERMIKENINSSNSNTKGLSPAERLWRIQNDELQKAQALQLERLQKTVEVAVLRKNGGEHDRRSPPPPPLDGKPPRRMSLSPGQDITSWLTKNGFSELVPVLKDMFGDVNKLLVAFQGVTAKDLRDELGLTGLPGLAVATRLREVLDQETAQHV